MRKRRMKEERESGYRRSYNPQMDLLKVEFPDFPYEDAKELISAIQEEKKIFVISDTYLFHKRLWEVLRPTAEGGRDPRNTELILSNWRNKVGPDDIILHLGDVALGIPLSELRERIGYVPGQIWLLPGNHDRNRKKLEVYAAMGWKIVKPFKVGVDKVEVYFSHEPIPEVRLTPRALNFHGHIHHNPAYSVRYVNCCIEYLGYRPVLLQPLIEKQIENYKKVAILQHGALDF